MEAQKKNVKQIIHSLQQQMIKLRRHFHQNPQLGLQEYKTAAFIRQYIQKNVPSAKITPKLEKCPTAVVAKFKKQKYKKRYLIRCDIDALPIKQESGLAFASKQLCSHMCGHDVHTTACLIAMRVLQQIINFIQHQITFVFQPGQQGKKGAKTLLDSYSNLLQDIDYCFALHMGNFLKLGVVSIPKKYVTSNSNTFKIQIKGKSCHSMIPQQGVDANYIGCSLVTHLYSLKNRILNPLQQGCLVVTKVQGGSEVSALSDSFLIKGSLRSVSLNSHMKIMKQLQNLSVSFSKSFNAQCKFTLRQSCYRTVQNKQPARQIMKNAILKMIQQQNILQGDPSLAGQDFCQFSQKKPSCYIIIGCGQENSIQNGQSIYPIHSSKFRLDQKAIKICVQVWANLCLN